MIQQRHSDTAGRYTGNAEAFPSREAKYSGKPDSDSNLARCGLRQETGRR